VCKSGLTNARKIWLTRHGESQYNQLALIGGDSSLSTNGEQYANLLPDILMSRVPKASPRADARQTPARPHRPAAALPLPQRAPPRPAPRLAHAAAPPGQRAAHPPTHPPSPPAARAPTQRLPPH